MAKILLIEDEASIRRVLVKILTEENSKYSVVEAEDGLVGTEKIKDEDFDLVLCDIKMPKMDGVEVLQAIKKIKPEVPCSLAIFSPKYSTKSGMSSRLSFKAGT